MSISLCMIVKNEEKTLSKCLESVKKYVSEMIVVDTGSEDRTKEIAMKHGAKVFDYKWDNSFSKARNEAIKHAKNDWILILDADEEISEWMVQVENVLALTMKKAFEIKIKHPKQKEGHHHHMIRLFKNHEGITYQGKIHEQLQLNNHLLNEKDVASLPIEVIHSGYSHEVIEQKNKEERNMTLLLEELEENPKNPITHLHLGNQYLQMKDYQKAIEHYFIATNQKKDEKFMKHAVLKMILAWFELKEYNELFLLLKEAKEMFPTYTDIYFAHGEILEQLGHLEGAVLQYKKCLELGEPTESFYSKEGVGSSLPLLKLKDIYYRQLNYHAEMEVVNILFTKNPENMDIAMRFFEMQEEQIGHKAVKEMINMMYQHKQHQVKNQLLEWWEAQKKYENLIECEKEVNCRMEMSFVSGIQFLLQKGQEEKAVMLVQEKANESFENKLVLAEWCYQQGLYQEAISYANELLNQYNQSFRPINLIMLSAEKLGEQEDVRSLANEMIKLIPYDEFFTRHL